MLQTLFHNLFVWVLSPDFRCQVIFSHNPLNLLVIYAWKPHFQASPAVLAFSFVKDLFDCEIIRIVFVWLVTVA